jgi:hypothetical protein
MQITQALANLQRRTNKPTIQSTNQSTYVGCDTTPKMGMVVSATNRFPAFASLTNKAYPDRELRTVEQANLMASSLKTTSSFVCTVY